MKKMLALLLLCTVALAFNQAGAHGSTKPEHGGVMQMVGETSFELVTLADRVEVYLVEEGDQVRSVGMTGKLTITSNGAKSEAVLVPAGDNKLEAKGVKVPGGAKVVVLVTRPDQSKMSATFTTK